MSASQQRCSKMFYFVLEKLEVPDFLSAIDTDWNNGTPSERFQEGMFDTLGSKDSGGLVLLA